MDEREFPEQLQPVTDAAFAEIWKRYYAYVLAKCRRELSNTAMAEDATQVVFLLVAKKAKTISLSTSLGGWLFQTARLVCNDMKKVELRRQVREQKAYDESYPEQTEALWTRMESHVNDALASLAGADRELILLRYFQGLSVSETAAALKIGEAAVQKRISRAISKMRAYFTKQGIIMELNVLTTMLSTHASPTPSPVISQPQAPSAHIVKITTGITKKMAIYKLSTCAVIAAVIGTSVVAVHYSTARAAVLSAPVVSAALTVPSQSTSINSSSGATSIIASQAEGTFTLLHQFVGSDGSGPYIEPPLGTDGTVYGITERRGADGQGTVFAMAPNGNIKTLHTFTGGPDGGSPSDFLERGSDGFLYGITSTGSTNGKGTIFKVSPDGDFTTLYSQSVNEDTDPVYFIVNKDGNYQVSQGSATKRVTVSIVAQNQPLKRFYSIMAGNSGVVEKQSL